MTRFHLAQVNIGLLRAPIEDPIMEGFRSQLDSINALADRSPGFVWRLQTEDGNALAIRPYADERRLKERGPWSEAFTFRTPFPSQDAPSGDMAVLDARPILASGWCVVFIASVVDRIARLGNAGPPFDAAR